jgi:hypothetical protein
MYKSRVGIQSRVISRSTQRFSHWIEMKVKMREERVEHACRKQRLKREFGEMNIPSDNHV